MSGAATRRASRAPLLEEDFFDRPPRPVAQDLIGCELLRDGVGGRIVETEAYEEGDPACHAFIGRTGRTDVLFGPPGRAYVYLCYGIHRMLNFVTEADGVAAAVLIRAIEPLAGIELMEARRGPGRPLRDLCSGPGKLCEALAVELGETRSSLAEPPFELRGRPVAQDPAIVAGPRIGITKGADLPWRYCRAGSPYLSQRAG